MLAAATATPTAATHAPSAVPTQASTAAAHATVSPAAPRAAAVPRAAAAPRATCRKPAPATVTGMWQSGVLNHILINFHEINRF